MTQRPSTGVKHSAHGAGGKPGDRDKRIRNRPARESSLLQAAARLFASRGYDATTTRDIAAEAVCAEGLIHRYFQGKEGLLKTLVRLQVSEQLADPGAHLANARDFETEFLQVVEWGVNRMWTDREFLRVVLPLALSDSPLGGEVRAIGIDGYVGLLQEHLQKHEPFRGRPAEEIDELARLVAGITVSFGFMLPIVFNQRRGRAKKIALMLTQNLIRDWGANERVKGEG